MRRIAAALLLIPLGQSTLLAAPPTLTQLFPPGGQRGQTVTVTASGSFSPWPVEGWCNSKLITVKPAKESGKLAVTIGADVIPGVYWIRLHNKEGASELRPFFVSNLPELVEQEPNDDFKKPHVVPGSVVVSGKLEKAGDVDGFAIQVRKGQTLVASLEAFNTLRSPMDGVLQIVSTDGFVLAQNNDFRDMDPQIAFSAPKDGTYIARVFAFPSKADSTIRFAGSDKMIYRLTLCTSGYVDYTLPLTLKKGELTPVELFGWNVPDATRKVVPTPRSDAEADVFHPLLANAATLRLESHQAIVKHSPATRVKPQVITIPATISGRLDIAGDVDVYQFATKKGDKLSFQIEARALHFPVDAVVRLTDLEGKTLSEASSPKLNIDPTLSYTVPSDGSFRIEIRDVHGNGGPRYVYQLRAVHAEPDYDLAAASDRITITPGKPSTMSVTINRRNGFGKEVALSVEGLPMGVTTEPLTLGASVKTATLKISADSGVASSAIRIVGKTSDGLVRYASATGAEPGWKTEHLWLTVLSAKK